MGRKRKPYKGDVDGKSAAAGETGTAVLDPEDLAGGGKAPEIQDLATGEIMDETACRVKLVAILKKREDIESAEAVLTQLKDACSEAGKAVGEQKGVVRDLKKDLADIEAGQKLLPFE